MTAPHAERRRAQRVDAQLKIQVQIPVQGGRLVPATLETLNISTSGIYFQSDRFIEPMTKLEMFLDLPLDETGADGATRAQRVRCEGIVVRVLPETAQTGDVSYEIAVFFTHFDPDALLRLEDHIVTLIASS